MRQRQRDRGAPRKRHLEYRQREEGEVGSRKKGVSQVTRDTGKARDTWHRRRQRQGYQASQNLKWTDRGTNNRDKGTETGIERQGN